MIKTDEPEENLKGQKNDTSGQIRQKCCKKMAGTSSCQNTLMNKISKGMEKISQVPH
ncbi:hypothetical protein [Frederiksenia canicola]|uniref:hypothetical protein n=1 Tax=Frederiksenia canicola TaxID=123824 RepID=UPI001B87E7B6|nr:hypothetical protein [Frederiksenia canicola]